MGTHKFVLKKKRQTFSFLFPAWTAELRIVQACFVQAWCFLLSLSHSQVWEKVNIHFYAFFSHLVDQHLLKENSTAQFYGFDLFFVIAGYEVYNIFFFKSSQVEISYLFIILCFTCLCYKSVHVTKWPKI